MSKQHLAMILLTLTLILGVTILALWADPPVRECFDDCAHAGR